MQSKLDLVASAVYAACGVGYAMHGFWQIAFPCFGAMLFGLRLALKGS